MPPKVQIMEQVVKQLENSLTHKLGMLFGLLYEDYALVVACNFVCTWEFTQPSVGSVSDTDDSSDSSENGDNPYFTQYPFGLELLGAVKIIVSEEVEEDSPSDLIPSIKEITDKTNTLYISKHVNSEDIDVFYTDGDYVCKSEYEILPYNKFLEKFIYINLKGTLNFLKPLEENNVTYDRVIAELTERLGAGVIFCLPDNNLIIYKDNTDDELTSIGKVFDSSSKCIDLVSGVEVLNATAFFSSSVDFQQGIEHGAPYTVDYSCGDFSVTRNVTECTVPKKLTFPLDILCTVYREKSLNDVHSLLASAIDKQLMFYGLYFNKSVENVIKVTDQELTKMEIKHFFNDLMGTPLSIISFNSNEEALSTLRKGLHENLNAPRDRPLFRKANALKFSPSSVQPKVLINVHLGLKRQPHRSPNCETAYVYGLYEYYHYCVEGFDDKHWGCAYRSLQTIFSWFRLQGYTETPVPTHLDIQKTLVEIGDKEAQFIGSTNWIGTTEVSFVLQSKLDVNCQIVYLSSGAELSTIGQTLLEHFELEGTPIMIGGGVLAHTIIGVSVDKDSGESRFLVLDPHYTGKDDVSAIQKSAYVGWKAPSFWSANTYYNLCLPLRPICF